jgi:MFS family permease
MGRLEDDQATGAIAPSTPEVAELGDTNSSSLAWLCVMGSFMFFYSSYGESQSNLYYCQTDEILGLMQSVGTIQSYLQLNQLSAYSSRDLGWISGIFTSLSLFLGIQSGPLMDAYGTKFLAPISVVVYVPVFFLMGECTEYWHFILCLGGLGGIGGALTGTVAVAVTGKLFNNNRRKGLAMGIALSGSSFGGVTISMILRSLLPRLGWQWSMRVLGFIVFGVMVLGVLCFLPYPRLSTHVSRARAPVGKMGAMLNFSAFKSPPFTFMAIGFFVLQFVLFGITGILPTFAVKAGFGSNAGFYLIAILNGTSCFGRIMTGVIGDRLGHINILLMMISITIVFMGVILVPFGTKHASALYTFTALWGYASGSFLSSCPGEYFDS